MRYRFVLAFALLIAIALVGIVAANGIIGDLDGDGSVGSSDLALLLGSWGPCSQNVSISCFADLDFNGQVDQQDLVILLNQWGQNKGDTNTTSTNVSISQCGVLNQPGTYVLTQNIVTNGTCFTITSNDVVLDGAEHGIQGDGGLSDIGVMISSVDNVKVFGLSVDSFGTGIYLNGVTNSLIEDNTLTNNHDGLSLVFSSDNLVSGDVIDSNSENGVLLMGADRNNFDNLWLHSQIRAFSVINGSANIFAGGTLLDNENGFFLVFGRDNVFKDSSISGTTGSALYLGSSDVVNTTFSNITFWNTVGSDLEFGGFGINDTKFIDTNVQGYSINNAASVFWSNSAFGSVLFLDPVQGSGLNLSDEIKVGHNNISVNSSSIFNKNATITFKGMSFTSPVAYRDGIPCSSSICSSITNLGNGTYMFNVTGWSSYSLAEAVAPKITQVEEVKNPNSGGGNCITSWTCNDWNACTPDGTQSRTCTKVVSYCYADPALKPAETQACTYTATTQNSQTQSGPIQQAVSTITGAVIGAVGQPAGLGVLIFIALIAGAYVAVIIFRRKNKAA